MGRNGAGGGPVTVMEMDGQATRVMSSVSVEVEVGAGRLYAPKKKTSNHASFYYSFFLVPVHLLGRSRLIDQL